MSNRIDLPETVSIIAPFSDLSTTLDPALFLGERDYHQVVKPFCENLLIALRHHMPEKLAHANSVGKLVQEFCLHAGMPEQEVLIYGEAARLHDIGYLSGSRETWRTAGKPDPEQSLERKIRHTRAGSALLDEFHLSGHPFIVAASEMARYHHERLDGNGPHRLQNLSRIIQIVGAIDAWDGDQIPKPGVPPRSPQEALDRLRTNEKYQNAYASEILNGIAAIADLS